MKELAEIMRAIMEREGSIPFERFMELALYHPEHGYYRREREKPRTGRTGDFFTSVSVGPLFGRLLARQFLEMWELLGKPAPFWIVEQGAEDARLAGDILAWCRAEAAAFFDAVRYGVIEDSARLREGQRASLAAGGLDAKAAWFRNLADLAHEAPVGVFFSNELADAFPVRRVVRRDGRWREFHVAPGAHGGFAWVEREIREAALAAVVETLPALEGCTTEVNLRARAWMEQVGSAMRRGYVVTIDYGFPAADYYAEFRRDGTLTAYLGHRRTAEILAEPGSRDITAHIDFTALAKAGEKAGVATLGFLDQQHFLTGIAHAELGGADRPRTGVAENPRAWQTLTHPEYLGARFRVLVQGKDAPSALAGLRYARPGGLE